MRTLLLDRDSELAALAGEIAAVRSGDGRMIVVEGPAGIGKSSLLAAAGQIAPAAGGAVLRARGGPLEQDAAWGVARELFEPLRGGSTWDELTAGAVLASWRVEATEALRRLGEHQTAARLGAEQLELAERVNTPGDRGAALRTLARASPATP